jgi:hypothetical protein
MSSAHRAQFCSVVSVVLGVIVLASCEAPPAAPDASPPSQIPTGPAGRFAVTSRFDIHVPPVAAPALAALTAATDGPDDPARYLVDRMIATLPDGTVKAIAIQAAPLIAAYAQQRLTEIAPRLVAGLAAISGGLSRIAGQVGTIETLRIDDTGTAVRAITGVRFELGGATTTVAFAEAGLADVVGDVRVELNGAGRVTLAGHMHRWPYGAVLRLGLDRAVVASVVPEARDLASALAALVDCDRLGALIADCIGVGAPALYRTACRAGMTAIASELDERIAAIDEHAIGLAVTGTAGGIDLDGDGSMDELRGGSWTGAVYADDAREAIAAGSFAGRKQP